MLKDMTDADLQKLEQKLKNLGVTVDTSHIRQQIEASVGATPFNAKVSFGNARADLESLFLNNKFGVNAEVIASRLRDSIKATLTNWSTDATILPNKNNLRKAVKDALVSSGFEVNVNRVTGLNATVQKALGSTHTLNIDVDPKKLAKAIEKAAKSYNGKDVTVAVKEKYLLDSIKAALRSEKFPIRVIVNKAEAQDAVRQALQAAGLQNQGFTASDKRAWDAQSRRMEAEARAAAASALAQRRLAGAHNAAQRATDSHIHSSISLGSAMRGNIRIAGELGPMLASAYSVVALKNFMQKVVEIGGELEKQKLAMNAILGNEGFANTITSQINSLAVKSPFGVMELNQYAKQLTAFQIPYNELYDTMKRMADVSAAVGVDMGRIILAYGQVRAAKFLKGTELRQFTEANIPMIDMLAQRFTKLKGEMVSAGDVMDMISNKEVTFEDVKAVLWELTGEGGRFYNMQEVLSESVQAKWKNLADAIDLMFADIAESTAGPLKGMAELLTALASRWKTIATIIASVAGTFGVAKVATLAWNAALSKTTLSAIKDAKSAKQIETANLRVASTYRTLTAAEQGLIHTKGRLTAAQYVQLAAEGKLTKEQVLRLIALKKLDANTIGHLRSVLGITKAEVSAAQATKAWRVRIAQLGATMRSVGSSIAGFFLNPLTIAMAAIGTVTALWQKNSEEMQKAKEIGDNVATSASEGFKNLKSSVENFKPGEGLTDVQLTQGIEQMQQLIKDYSPTPIEDINNALVAQDGHIRSLVGQYWELYERINSLKYAYQELDNRFGGQMVEGALKATDGGNWFTQLFDDNLAENAKDYTNALGRVSDRIAKYSREYADNMKNAVIAALNADERFRNAVSGMTSYDEKLRFLAEHSGDYYKAMSAFDADMNKRDNGKRLDYFSNSSQIQKAHDELLKDTDKFIADYNSRLQQQGINPFLMTPNQKTAVAIAMKSMLAQLEDAGEDAKAIIAKKLEDSWGLAGMIIEDKIGPSMQEKFRAIVGASTDEGVKMAARKLQYEGYNELSTIEKETVKRLMEQAKRQTMADLKILNSDMQNYLTTHPLSQIITLSYVSDNKPSDLAKELVKKHGYPGLTESTNRYVTSWTSDNSVYNARNAAQSALKAAKNELDAAKKAGAGVKAAQKKWDEVWAALEYLGWTDLQTKDKKSNKHSGSKGTQKDKVAEDLKQRFKDIKDAWSEFQKWSKTEGREAAAARIGESGLFSTLPKDKIPQTVEQYRALVADLEKELRAAGVKGSARESLLNELLKQLLDIDKTVVDEQLKLALDKVTKEAERQLADWNLYDKVRKATGNKKLAMNLAFGMNMTGETDYVSMIKKQFDAVAKAAGSSLTYGTVTPELLKDAPEEVRKAYEKAFSEIQKYHDKERNELADMVAQYKNTQEEIVALTAEAEEKKRKIRESKDLTDVQKQQLIDKIDSELNYETFRRSGEYLKFFNAILSFTGEEAENVGRKIKQALDDKLKAGSISAKEYCDEMEKIDKQLDKIRSKQGDFGNFIKGGLQNLFQKRYEQSESDYNAATQNFTDAKNAFDVAQQKGDKAGMQQAQAAMDAAGAMKEGAGAAMQGAQGAMQTMQAIDMIVHGINDTVQGIKGAMELITEMAESYGADTGADTDWGKANAFMSTFGEASQHATDAWDALKSGNVGGVIKGVIGSVTSWFTGFNKWHDAKLQAQIEKSKKVMEILQHGYDALERRMEHFLGNGRNVDITGLFNVDEAKARVGEIEEKLEKKLNKLSKMDGKAAKNLAKGTLIGTGVGAALGPLGLLAGSLVGSVVGGVMDLVNSHKKRKLIKQINKLYEEQKRLLAEIEAYESGGTYGLQRQYMKEQLEELNKQRKAEDKKKNSDKKALADMDDQIDELTVKIMSFAEETAQNLYGIDLKGWADQIGDSLVDAFAKGEDAAEAFNKTVGEIMRSVVSKVISVGIIQPMMQDLQNWLFGDGTDGYAKGEGGAFGHDFELQPGEVATLGSKLKLMQNGVGKSKELFDQINELMGGMLSDTESTKNGLSAGIQGITEDTADLLASYLNAVRADVAQSTREYWPKLLNEALPGMSIIAESQLKVQEQIASNTLRNAVAAELIVKSNDNISRLLVRVTQGTDKFHVN